MLHRSLDVAVAAAVVEAVGEAEGDHIAEVTLVLNYGLLDIAAEELGLVRPRIAAEGILRKEGNLKTEGCAVGGAEVPGRSLMPAMLALHEVPSVVGICP